jgi:alpha-amylase/alpha-mannosidase (GH57 family)
MSDSGMEWFNNLNVGVVIVFFLAVEKFVEYILKNFNKAYKIKRGKEDTQAMLSRHDTELKDMTDAMTKMFGIITKQDSENKKNDCAILRNMIIDKFRDCKETHDKYGYIGTLDYENLSELFSRYFESGGNHLISHLYKQFKSFSISLDESELIVK